MGPSVRSPLKRCDYPLPEPDGEGHALLSAGPTYSAQHRRRGPEAQPEPLSSCREPSRGTHRSRRKGFPVPAALQTADVSITVQYLCCIAPASPSLTISPTLDPRRADHAAMPLPRLRLFLPLTVSCGDQLPRIVTSFICYNGFLASRESMAKPANAAHDARTE